MPRIVFVCTGNICRSPAAHVVFDAALGREGIAGWEVSSAGTDAYHEGELADPRTIEEGTRRGYRFPHHSRPVSRRDLDADLLVAMDRGHLATLQRMVGGPSARVVLFRNFDPGAGAGEDVADPYYGGPEGFVEMFNVIERSMPALLAHCRELAGR